MSDTSQGLIDQVLARIPRGRYLMTSHFEAARAGILVDSAMWLMESPLLIGVSVQKGHEIDPLIRDSRSFAIGFISDDDKFITRRFSPRLNSAESAIHVEGMDPFETLQSTPIVTGSPTLSQCDLWLDCEVLRRVDLENAQEFFVGSVVGIKVGSEIVHIEQDVDMSSDED